MRFEVFRENLSDRDFFTMEDSPKRFSRFLSEFGGGMWDIHVLPQTKHLPVIRSRKQRADDNTFRRFMISPGDLNEESRTFIERVYKQDIALRQTLQSSSS